METVSAHRLLPRRNDTAGGILLNALLAAVSLFVNGFGVYLTIQANIGAGPWDVLNLGVSRSLGILYGTASVAVSLLILGIDVLMKEPIGIAMFIDAVVVGKAVDFFNWIHAVPACGSLMSGIPVMLAGLVIMAYTQVAYMAASLSCGPRDTLLVGPVGVGTLICAFCTGPIMQLAFRTLRFDATGIRHQRLRDSVEVFVRHIHGQAGQ